MNRSALEIWQHMNRIERAIWLAGILNMALFFVLLAALGGTVVVGA